MYAIIRNIGTIEERILETDFETLEEALDGLMMYGDDCCVTEINLLEEAL